MLLCAPLIGLGLSVNRHEALPLRPIVLADVVDAQIVEIRDSSGATVASGEFRSRTDAVGDTEKDAALTRRDGQALIGEVEIEIPGAARPHRQPELEVDVIGLAGNSRHSVVIDDRIVATFVTDDRGSIDEELQEGESITGRVLSR